ncbi:sensor histidine kinase [Asanoa iriomotensis]|uniref:sensor histidine kinase n=1 Tax=Asanoa iriomotensis TaxID=234613 RepID=UPI001943D42B|nr:sensor histidine kinase [Asanoa iriomotensis]
MRPISWVFALAGAAALGSAVVLDLVWGDPAHALWALSGPAPFYLVGLLASWHRPDHLAVRWLLATGTLFAFDICLGESLLGLVISTPAAPVIVLLRLWVGLGATAAGMGLIGLFPSGRPENATERAVLWTVGAQVALLPLFAAVTNPDLLRGVYPEPGQLRIPSPVYVEELARLGPAADWLLLNFALWTAVGFAMLALRYRRSAPARRRQIRWLLVGGAAGFVAWWAQVYLLLWLGPDSVAVQVGELVLWPLTVAMVLGSLLVALFYDGVFGIDRPARRRLAYRLSWTLIGVAHVCAAAGLGLLAARLSTAETAVLVAVAASLALLPVRGRLQQVADRWVFGARLDGYELLTRFGASLDQSPGPARLLQTLAETVRRGLDLTWTRVRLTADPATGAAPAGADATGFAGTVIAAAEEPALTVVIRHGDTELGRIECGPRQDGNVLVEEDRRLLGYLAGQAAAAVHNLHLAAELSVRLGQIRRQAAELSASRQRVVAGQDAERRRIQRDLHDGVQQHVVAATAKLGLARQRIGRGDPRGEQLLAELYHDLGQLLNELRDVAYAIHPPVLSDRGLLEAVEAQAARLPVPMAVRADPALRAVRYPPAIEATAWYALAEALSNVVKHANAVQVDVSLLQRGDRLQLTVRDDGCGFDPAGARGLGLAGLTDRLDVLGGTLSVDSAAGRGTTLSMEIPLDNPDPADA